MSRPQYIHQFNLASGKWEDVPKSPKKFFGNFCPEGDSINCPNCGKMTESNMLAPSVLFKDYYGGDLLVCLRCYSEEREKVRAFHKPIPRYTGVKHKSKR